MLIIMEYSSVEIDHDGYSISASMNVVADYSSQVLLLSAQVDCVWLRLVHFMLISVEFISVEHVISACCQLQLLQTTPPLPLQFHPQLLLLPAQVCCVTLDEYLVPLTCVECIIVEYLSITVF